MNRRYLPTKPSDGFFAALLAQTAEREKQQQREVEMGDFDSLDDEMRREMDLDPVFWRNQ